ncbi:MAG: 50S ribosomal protein L7 [Ruminococcaceae bacterium]|nr:50S ribosomal protein L7 [Oscillospiraceae bacterium]
MEQENRAIRYLSIARKAGSLQLGEEDTGIAVRGGKAKLVLLAFDASDNARRRAEGFVYGRKMPLVRLPYTKEEISFATGKGGCSMLAVTDIGLASSFLSALAQQDPERYAETAQALELKREKANKRKAEAAAHRRNVKTGKRRTTK